MSKPALPRFAWWNGAIVPYRKVTFGLLTHTLNYGTGLFEGIRAYWNEEHEELYVFRMRDHYERFTRNWKTLMFDAPYSVDDLCDATRALLREEGYRRNAYIRPLALKTDEKIGLYLPEFTPGVGIVAVPFDKYVTGGEEGLKAVVSSWRRPKNIMIPPDGKITGIYVNSHLAAQEARQHGAHEAIMLTDDGYVSEASGANLFLVQYGRFYTSLGPQCGDVVLYTPPPSDDILVGITRDTVMQLAALWNITTIERRINPTELWKADEVFLTGTAHEIAPVVEINGRQVGKGGIGPVTARLREVYARVVKNMPSSDNLYEKIEFVDHDMRRGWATPVYAP